MKQLQESLNKKIWGFVEIEVLQSKHHSQCLVVNGHRVAGPKCYGGGKVLDKFIVSRQEISIALWKD